MGTSFSVTGSISTAGGGSAAALVASRQPAESAAITTAIRLPMRTREKLTARDACEFITTPFEDRKSTRLNSSHGYISYAVFCLKKKKQRSQDQLSPCDTPRSPRPFRS